MIRNTYATTGVRQGSLEKECLYSTLRGDVRTATPGHVAGKSLSDSNLAIRIDLAMHRRGLNQTELAEQLGIKPPAVNMWISGASEPGKKRLPQLSEILDVPIEWLMGVGMSEAGRRFERMILGMLKAGDAEFEALMASHEPDKLMEIVRAALKAEAEKP